MNFGQTCHAGTRIYVHEDVYDRFLELYTARMKKVTVGNPSTKDVDQGPQNSKLQYDKILGYIKSGEDEGAKVHLGGKAIGSASDGYFIEPTIFTNVKPEMKIMREEIFGPVVTVSKFRSEDEVLEAANNTSYGLASGIFTKDYERAVRVTSKLRAGTAWINLYNFVHWFVFSVKTWSCCMLTVHRSMPFGGYKESGIGRECGEMALQNYTEVKTVYLNMGLKAPA